VLRFQALPVKARLTIWYVAVFAAVLALYIAGLSFVLYFQLRSQLGRFAVEDVETVEGLLYFGPDGLVHLRENYHNHLQSRLVQERFLEVLSPDGTILYQNERLGRQSLGGPLFAGEGVGGYSRRTEKLTNGDRVLLVSRRHVLEGRPVILRLAYSESSIWSRIGEVLTASLTALPVLLAIAGFLGYRLARKALSPVEEMTSRAEQITANNLKQRLPVKNPRDELGALATVFNSVLDRLGQSFEQLQRFTSDASHELRTPLAAIRSVGEVGLQKGKSAAEYREIIGSMLEEVNRLTRLVETLLTISRADAGQIQPSFSVFPVGDMVREVASVIEVLIDDKKQNLHLHIDRNIMLKADRLLLRHAVLNILQNAVNHSPEGGDISVHVAAAAGRVQIRIADSGPGIPAEHRQHIFDRFYRVDAARARNTGGTGLGLAIAKWAVQVQGGQIRIEEKEENAGAVFCIELRLADPVIDPAGVR
jgi:heavy metal sensor kinase